MDEQAWQLVVREAAGMQHDRPVDTVRGDEYVLADDVHNPGTLPRFGKIRQAAGSGRGIAETGEADVVRQGIEPDISHKIPIKRQLNPPRQAAFRPRDAQVHALAFHRFDELGQPVCGEDEFRVRLQVTTQPGQVFS